MLSKDRALFNEDAPLSISLLFDASGNCGKQDQEGGRGGVWVLRPPAPTMSFPRPV
jgi:hypothetical protein